MEQAQSLMDLGGGVGIFGTLLIGALAGWIAEKLTKGDHGLLTNIVVGIAGSFVGGWLANVVGLRLGEIFQGWFFGKPQRQTPTSSCSTPTTRRAAG